jgi:hypothetical protein
MRYLVMAGLVHARIEPAVLDEDLEPSVNSRGRSESTGY